MGVYDNLLRESLNFDLYLDDGKLLSHPVVVSRKDEAGLDLRNSRSSFPNVPILCER
jgi:hypothetical protein